MPTESLACLPKEGAGNPWFPPGVWGSPPQHKRRRVGGGIAAHAKASPPLMEGAGHNKTTRPGYASATAHLQNPNDCARVSPGSGQPVHSASSKPCRIREHWGPTVDPCGGRRWEEHHRRLQWQPPTRPWGKAPRGDVPPAPQPSEEGWDRSGCRFKTSSLKPSGPVTAVTPPLRIVTLPLRLRYAFVTPLLRLVTPLLRLHAYGRRRRRKNSNGYNQRTRLRPGVIPAQPLSCA